MSFNLRLKPEEAEQKAVIDYLNLKYPDVLKTISPQGMRLTMFQGLKFKMLGYEEGTCDILIFEPRDNYHGLFIEMKAPSRNYLTKKGVLMLSSHGVLSERQKIFIERANSKNYRAICCIGSDEAIKIIDEYFRGEKR